MSGADRSDGKRRLLILALVLGLILLVPAGLIYRVADRNTQTALLIEHGADINHADTMDTPLMSAADKTQDLTYLLAHGADPNLPNRNGTTPLMVAAALGNPVTTKALLQAGAKIPFQNRQGETALMYAAHEGQTDTVLLLLKSGADPAMRDQKGQIAEDYATAQFHTQVALAIHQYRPHNLKN